MAQVIKSMLLRNMLKIICSYLPLTGLPTLSGYTALSVSADLTVAKRYQMNFVRPSHKRNMGEWSKKTNYLPQKRDIAYFIERLSGSE